MLYPKDAKVSVVKDSESIELRWNWYRKDRGVRVINALMLAGIGIGGLLAPDKPGEVTPQFIHMIFWFFLIAMVPGMAIYAATWFVNKSIVRANKQSIRISSYPFPWVKTIEIVSERITQFFVTQSRSSGTKHWTLYYIDADSNYRELGKYFTSEIAAFQVCHELQDFYGLEDLPVYGQTSLSHQPGPRAR